MNHISNPKRAIGELRSSWFPYYAGFSKEFVRDAITSNSDFSAYSVCDPWNGSGTTTLVGAELGLKSYGLDINPAMNLIATARSTRFNLPHLTDSSKHILATMGRSRLTTIDDADPLLTWFCPKAAIAVRKITSAVNCSDSLLAEGERAFFYVGLFRAIKKLTRRFRGSNPTWIKRPCKRSRLRFQTKTLFLLFREIVDEMFHQVESSNGTIKRSSSVEILQSQSTNLPLSDDTIDLLIGSPPYCTRIDYAVSTSIELACLDFDIFARHKSMRHNMTGTSTIRPGQQFPVDRAWGKSCCTFLKSVELHPSKSSANYYLKTYLQYFSDIFESLGEIQRVVKSSGAVFLVVQDSYYKDLHLDLSRILIEMGTVNGLSLIDQFDFDVARDMGRVNPRASEARRTTCPIETVLKFKN